MIGPSLVKVTSRNLFFSTWKVIRHGRGRVWKAGLRGTDLLTEVGNSLWLHFQVARLGFLGYLLVTINEAPPRFAVIIRVQRSQRPLYPIRCGRTVLSTMPLEIAQGTRSSVAQIIILAFERIAKLPPGGCKRSKAWEKVPCTSLLQSNRASLPRLRLRSIMSPHYTTASLSNMFSHLSPPRTLTYLDTILD